MKIALLADSIFPYEIGGMQKHSYYLTKYFAKNGIYVDSYCGARNVSQGKELEVFSDVERKYINLVTLPLPQLGYFPGHYLRESYLHSQNLFDQFKNNLDVDFVYVQGFAGWELLKRKNAGLRMPPVAINMHGLEMFQKPASFRGRLEQWLFRPFVKSNLINSDVVFSLGGGISDIIAAVGIPPERIVEIPIGVESTWLRQDVPSLSKPRRFVFVGRYERRKGIEELIQVIKALLNENSFEFHFIGNMPDSVKIQSPQIQYWGLIKNPEKIQAVLSKCDVLVCPSYSEGMPTVILEAMATGLAIIATDVGAVSELVSKDNGWLIPAGDKLGLKSAILDAINESGQRLMQKKSNSQEIVKNQFTWDILIQKTIREIEKIVYKK